MTEENLRSNGQLDLYGMRWMHHFTLRRYRIPLGFVLNSTEGTPPKPATPTVASELRSIVNRMKAEAFDVVNGQVDYARLKGSRLYEEYRRCTQVLSNFDPKELTTRNEQLAFWINLYNALIVDAVIQFGVEASVHEVPGFFWRAAYAIGGRRYCAHDIEHGVLRANNPYPAIPGPHFGAQDARRDYRLRLLDPRVHFALVCGAMSCPPISAYEVKAIDQQLDLAAHSFINGGAVQVDRTRHEVWISKIFQWYATDFGAGYLGLGDKRPLLRYVAGFVSDESDKDFLLNKNPKVRFQVYDWALNLIT